jgi:hypothetical protein
MKPDGEPAGGSGSELSETGLVVSSDLRWPREIAQIVRVTSGASNAKLLSDSLLKVKGIELQLVERDVAYVAIKADAPKVITPTYLASLINESIRSSDGDARYAALESSDMYQEGEAQLQSSIMLDAIPVWLPIPIFRRLQQGSSGSKQYIEAPDMESAIRKAVSEFDDFRFIVRNFVLVTLKSPMLLSAVEIDRIVRSIEIAVPLRQHPSGPMRLTIDWYVLEQLGLSAIKSHETIDLLNKEQPVSVENPRNPIDEIADTARNAELEQRASVDQLLGELATTSSAVADLNSRLDSIVSIARDLGISWRQIADAVGISGSAAHRRWDPEARRKHAEYRRNQGRSAG